MMKRNTVVLLGTLGIALLAAACGWYAGTHRDALATHASHGAHAIKRPSNQTAVVTVWSSAETLGATGQFYEHVLELERVGDSTEPPGILDTDGTFLIVMRGTVEEPRGTTRRWPQLALSVPNLDNAVRSLEDAGVEPWGIEEFGSPEPSSRYVMFRDPAGNLIEVVEWL